jgi:2-deoxy-D-gluconate 3-dehydrogenase
VYDFLLKVKANHPRIDILVNNAGHIMRKPAAEHPDEYWDSIIDINLNTQFIITREIGQQMIAQGSGKIIFTCSLLSFQGGINVPGYAASKGAIASLLKAFANEWSSKGVNVNGVAPGYIATDNTAQLRADEERNKAILQRIPAGRWGSTADLTGAYVFLASPASDYICGSIITVDGGWMGR